MIDREDENDQPGPLTPPATEHDSGGSDCSPEGAAPAKRTQSIGLGISNGTHKPNKSLPSAPSPTSTPPPRITVDTSGGAPLPPPKPERSPSRGKPQAVPSRIVTAKGESKEDLQEVELSRRGTPVDRIVRRDSETRRASNPASTSVSSLHSVTSSIPSPSRPASARPRPLTHSRRSSTATALSLTSHHPSAPGPQLSSVLITPPLQVLVNSKEARRSPSFLAAAQRALELCQAGEGASNAAYLHPREIFEPLRLAISNPQTTSVPILITSLDLLSKLISHSFFSEPDGPPRGMSPLPDLITHTITLSYSETSPPQVALQVVKALMAIVLSTDKGMLVHQSSLLKAVRTVYNVFLLSNDAANQVVAQGGLTQMVHHVFGRVVRPEQRSFSMGGKTDLGAENEARRAEMERTAAESVAEEEVQTEDGKSSETPEPNGAEEKLTL